MEPAAETQPLVPFGPLVHHHFFDRMVAPPRLDLEEDELVPAGRNGFTGDRLRVGCVFNDRIQLQSASIFWFPRFPVRQRHIQDEGNSTGPDDVVVIEQVAAFLVGVHGHVLLGAGDGAASCDILQEAAELVRVQGVAEGKEVGQKGDLFVCEVVEGSEISGLVDL